MMKLHLENEVRVMATQGGFKEDWFHSSIDYIYIVFSTVTLLHRQKLAWVDHSALNREQT